MAGIQEVVEQYVTADTLEEKTADVEAATGLSVEPGEKVFWMKGIHTCG